MPFKRAKRKEKQEILKVLEEGSQELSKLLNIDPSNQTISDAWNSEGLPFIIIGMNKEIVSIPLLA